MEDLYANEARSAERRGDSRLAVNLQLQAVQADTNKLSENRIQCFKSYIRAFVSDDDDPVYVPPENKDLRFMLYSFLNNPNEPTFFRAFAAMGLATIYDHKKTGRQNNAELAAIYARRCIQECFQASIEERNHVIERTHTHDRVGELLNRARDHSTELLARLECPETVYASQLVSIQYPTVVTSYGVYDTRVWAELFGDSISLDHLARRLTVGGVTCDFCGKERDPMDLCSLLCCDRCEMAYYCSADCQRRQWKEGGHKKACRDLGEFREGDAIRIDGLKAMSQYNNCIGCVVRPADDSGGDEQRRWAVRTYEPSGAIIMLCIKESNMRRIRPSDIQL